MVGFWKEIAAKPRGVDKPGPGQPLPDPTKSKYTWYKEMECREEFASTVGAGVAGIGSSDVSCKVFEKVVPVELTSIWESIESGVDAAVIAQHSATATVGVAGVKTSSSSSSSHAGVSYNTCFQGF